MIPRKTKDVYVAVQASDPELIFKVVFHDNCEKHYKFDKYEVSASRCSERDFIENVVRDYYESINKPNVSLNLIFV